MIAKKSNKADLEKKRFAFFQIGMIVAGSLTLAAFEYSTVKVDDKKTFVENDGPSMISIEIPFEDVVKEKPEPQQQQKTNIQFQPDTELKISKNVATNQIITASTKIVITEPCDDCKETGITLVPEDGDLVDVPDKEPEFIGGIKAMYAFISENIVYPDLAHQMNQTGTVNVHFIVNKDGSISDVKSESKVAKQLVDEAIRVVSMMPNWAPGEQAGKPVRVRFTVPINFTIKN